MGLKHVKILSSVKLYRPGFQTQVCLILILDVKIVLIYPFA